MRFYIHIFRSILKPNNLKVVPVGLNRGVKKIVSSRIPNLGRLEDLADIVTGAGNISESEAEVDDHFGIVIGKVGRAVVPAIQEWGRGTLIQGVTGTGLVALF